MKAEELETLASIYKALGNKTRLSVLLQLEEDEPVTPLTEELDITRSGLQSNIERLIDAELVYRPVDPGPTYSLTPLGKIVVNKIHENQDEVIGPLNEFHEIWEDLKERESDALETMREAGVDTSALETKLKAQAWENLE